jgi:DNA-binding MarR family transcriptional regulator
MTEVHYRDLDEVIHGRLRLALMAFLSTARDAEFQELRDVLEVTAGNLSVQLRTLEEAGYVVVTKSHRDRRSLTTVAITAAGDAALARYRTTLRQLLDAADGPR